MAAAPGFEPGLAPGSVAPFRSVLTLSGLRGLRGRRARAASQQVQASGEIGIREIARERVEDAGPGWRRAEAEIVAVQQVAGGRVVQLARRAAVALQQPARHEVDHHAPHLVQELGYRQPLVRPARLPDHRMPAERLQRRPGRPGSATVPPATPLDSPSAAAVPARCAASRCAHAARSSRAPNPATSSSAKTMLR